MLPELNLDHMDLEAKAKARAPERSFLFRVSVATPVVNELDNLSPQEALRYLEQRKLLDDALRHARPSLQKLATP
jgi:hypothetical protein